MPNAWLYFTKMFWELYSVMSVEELLWRAVTALILEKNTPKMQGQMKIFHVCSHQYGESLLVAPRIVVFVLLNS